MKYALATREYKRRVLLFSSLHFFPSFADVAVYMRALMVSCVCVHVAVTSWLYIYSIVVYTV